MRLPSHTSHLIQPLDVGLFSPLKKALGITLEPIFGKEVSRLHKSEWLTDYIEAREKAFCEDNVLDSWCGAELIPFNLEKVLQHIPPPPPS
jgi:hypothetical protein